MLGQRSGEHSFLYTYKNPFFEPWNPASLLDCSDGSLLDQEARIRCGEKKLIANCCRFLNVVTIHTFSGNFGALRDFDLNTEL